MNLLISMAIWWMPVLLLLAGLQVSGKGKVDWRWIGAAIVVFATYSFVVFYAPSIPGFPSIEGSRYNWTGKAASIISTLIMILIATRTTNFVTRESLGLTLKQNRASLRPALVATAAMLALVVVLQLLAADGAQTDFDTLAYQATMPGLDEELIFRGLLLALVAGALSDWKHTWRWAGIAVTIVFAFGHAYFYKPEGSQFDPIALGYVSILGALMMFIRLRTGSILIPILAHNLTNVVNKLV